MRIIPRSPENKDTHNPLAVHSIKVDSWRSETSILVSVVLVDCLGQCRNNLVQVTNDTIISYIEDGSVLILVDSDDDVRIFHTSYVLNCTLGFQPLSTTAREQDTVP